MNLNHINHLPVEILSSVFHLLSVGELFAIRRTCKLWKQTASQAGLTCEITRWDLVSKDDNNTTTNRTKKLNFVNDSTLFIIANYFQRLETISLVGLPDITDAGVKQLTNSFQHTLRKFSINDCIKVKKPGLTLSVSADQTQVFPNLTNVSFANNQSLNAGNLLGLKNCANIQTLNLSGCRKIDDLSMKYLASNNLTLRHLIIKGCFKITPDGFNSIFKLTKLKTLNAEGCTQHMTDTTFTNMASTLGNVMQELYLKSCVNLSEDVLQKYFPAFNQLVTISLNFCTQVSDATLNAIVLSLGSNLKALHLQGCEKLTNNSIQTVVEHCKHLQLLDFRGCNFVTDGALSDIHKLHLLDLRVCKNITDVGISFVCASEPNCLLTLDLENCQQITDNSLINISNSCIYLEIFNLFGCHLITSSGLFNVMAKLQQLTILVVRACSISFNTVQQLHEMYTHCKIVH